jgi:hypothetical protein
VTGTTAPHFGQADIPRVTSDPHWLQNMAPLSDHYDRRRKKSPAGPANPGFRVKTMVERGEACTKQKENSDQFGKSLRHW